MKTWKKIICMILCAVMLPVISGLGTEVVFGEVKAADYLLPDAATRYYTESDISGMSVKILCYAKNEIYARHGRKFQSKELQEYFSSQPWYYGNVEPENFSEDVFNVYEKANAKLLTDREFELQSGGYVLDQLGYSYSDVEDYIYGGGGFSISSGLSVHYSEGLGYLETDYFTICLPGNISWEYEIVDQDTISFIYTPARDSGVGGRFLTITAYDWSDNGYESLPRWSIAGLDEEKKYVASLPTDLQYDASDSLQTEEFQRLIDAAERCDRNNENSIFSVKNP